MKAELNLHKLMDGDTIYRRSEAGVIGLATFQPRLFTEDQRKLMLFLDGHRTISDLSHLFGADAVRGLIAELEEAGYVKCIGTARSRIGADQSNQPDSRVRPSSPRARPNRRWLRDWFALTNFGMLILVLVMGVGVWAVGSRPTVVTSPSDARPAPVSRPERAETSGLAHSPPTGSGPRQVASTEPGGRRCAANPTAICP